jgi:hypothetical protein
LDTEKQNPQPSVGERKAYEPPAVVASYSVDELRRAAAVSAVSIA